MMARKSGMKLELDFSSLQVRADDLEEAVNVAVGKTVDYAAPEGVAYMKESAPWTDRTTNARNGLHEATTHVGNVHSIIFSHTVYYGIWLEIANSGKYQIIMPTVRRQGHLIMERLDGLFGKLERGEGRPE